MSLLKSYYKKIKSYYVKFESFRQETYKDIFYTDKYIWDENKPLLILIGFNPWKRKYMQEYLDEYNIAFVKGKTSSFRILKGLRNIKSDYSNYKVYIWSYKEKKLIYRYLRLKKIAISRVEDGFIRSIGLGSNRAKPLSIVIDEDSLYFNVFRESKLEKIIQESYQNYSENQLKEARELIDLIKKNKITKYNFIEESIDSSNLDLLISKSRKNILVIGQVEGDMSIQLGCQEPKTLEDLLSTAICENLGANILYKIHPDIVKSRRKNNSNLEFPENVTLLPSTIHLHQLLARCDHVYTITSLSGFEALLYGKKVTCLGTPFYSQWGLTDDRELKIERRKNFSLTLEELVYSTLIAYPKYIEGTAKRTIAKILRREGNSHYDFNGNFSFYTPELNKKKIQKLKNKKIALLTTSSDIGEMYLHLNSQSDITVFSTTLIVAEAIHRKNIILSEKCHFINKYFMEPLSDMEDSVCNLATNIANYLKDINELIIEDIFTQEENKLFSQVHSEYIEDMIFQDCSLYLSLQKLVMEYDYIIFYDNKKKQNFIYNILKNPIYEEKVLFAFKLKDNNFKDIQEKVSPSLNINCNFMLNKEIDEIRVAIRKYWNSEELKTNNDISNLYTKSEVVLCGNLTNKNYAYYPASQEVLKMDLNNKNLKFLSSSFLNIESEKNQKLILFEDTHFTRNIDFYPLLISDIMGANNNLGLKFNNILKKQLYQIYYSYLNKKIPSELLNLLQQRIFTAVDKLALHLALYFEMKRVSSKVILYITTMERTLISRLYTLVMNQNNIKTIGIQPQVISTSKRYRKPIVDTMLVIDPLQEKNYKFFGYTGIIIKVGSANLRKHLNLIEVSDKIFDQGYKVSILFIMQHSMPKLMYTAIEALKSIDEKIHIYLKPHPMQETQVLEQTIFQISTYKNITLLDKDDDTYQYMNSCNVIVGVFSSAVYEGILVKKDVVVLKLEKLHPSIDFVQTGACAEATNIKELLEAINSFLNNDKIAKGIRNKQKNYIKENSYMYSTEEIHKSIIKRLTNE